MKAIVLGGGSVKGAFQVGALRAVLEAGFEPEMIYGISVGALNTAFLLNSSGKSMRHNNSILWPSLGKSLENFWIKHINNPQSIGLLRSRMALGIYTLMSRFEGLLDPEPLYDLIKKHVSPENIRASNCQAKVGAVNITNGEMLFVNKEDPQFIPYLLASSAIPVVMPAVEINEKLYMDGGLRQVVPASEAIMDGATEIILIACHSKHVILRDDFNVRNLISQIERVRDITVNQLANNDIIWAENYAEQAKKVDPKFKLTVIRPSAPLSLDLQKFTKNEIAALIKEGYETAKEFL